MRVRFTQGLSASTTAGAIAPYLNYVSVRTTGSIDDLTGYGSFACDASHPCYQFHNGAVLVITNGDYFGGVASTNAIPYMLDVDGVADGKLKALRFFMYFNGGIRTHASCDPTTFQVAIRGRAFVLMQIMIHPGFVSGSRTSLDEDYE